MSSHQHTALLLLLIIVAIRLASSGRIATAWGIVAGSGASNQPAAAGSGVPAAAPGPYPSGTQFPRSAQ